MTTRTLWRTLRKIQAVWRRIGALSGVLLTTGLILGGIGCSATGSRANAPPQQEISRSERYPYSFLLYLPETYENGKKKWPLLLFLHGSGERGTDLSLVKKNGPPRLIEEGREYPFIVVSPQLSEDQSWMPDVMMSFLRAVIDRYRVDENRIYVTGLSLGGYGTWALAGKYPDEIAAIAPVCGGGKPSRVAGLNNMPIWAFHGEKDRAVPVEEERQMIEAVRQEGNTNVKFTVYENVGHAAWTRAYRTEELYEWLLRQRRPHDNRKDRNNEK